MESTLINNAEEWAAWVAARAKHQPFFDHPNHRPATPQLPVLAVWIEIEIAETENTHGRSVVHFKLFTQPDIARTLEKMDS